jgi:molybdopterin converting factor small subunit
MSSTSASTGVCSIRAFGPLSDILPEEIAFSVRFPLSVGELRRRLTEEIPELTSMGFRIAVDGELVPEDRLLKGTPKLALLPPFAGG